MYPKYTSLDASCPAKKWPLSMGIRIVLTGPSSICPSIQAISYTNESHASEIGKFGLTWPDGAILTSGPYGPKIHRMNMGRPIEFDPDRVIDQAMQVFWSQGFTSTSLQDLLHATGLSKSSLYQAFHSKQKLFDRCIEHYLNCLAEQLLSDLENADSGRRFIEDTFLKVVDDVRTPQSEKGCLLWNTAVEFGQRDPEVAKRVASGMERLAAIFEKSVRRAQAESDIPPERDPKVLSHYLLSSMSGLRSMLKSRFREQEVRDVVQVIFSSLD